ncbi:hypothetical protein M422DRAFT_35751 [Sphaerobolus stellatus SS14]|uniref:Ankyrin repeat protein n=1 Tax=Sphaerobolus stellatus (strain SS14) TaxID=990650 RepID=A0A0C9V5D5_SPHS4|nr:hypothetical protein M422DRAFT_35751 [Sphaerobolus stellatus SS14]
MQGGLYGNALKAAAYCNNEAIVRLLLDHGAKLDESKGLFKTAKQAAARNGHNAVVNLLEETERMRELRRKHER